jgi:hypothetical protein
VPRNIRGVQRETLVATDVSYVEPGWSISASSGWIQVTCSAPACSARRGSVVCALSISGQFWQRDRDLAAASLTRDFQILLPQVVLELKALERLQEMLTDWQASRDDVEAALTGAAADQHLSFSIGKDDGLIYTPDKPACTVRYECGPAMSGRSSFVVDQSCIRICSEEIRDFISRVSPS